MDKYTVAIYLRLSVDDKKVESMSIESQRVILRKHAEALGVDNIEIIEYVDNGYSGTNFERPSVQQLLDDVQAFKINCIMVKDFSRFGRNSIEVGYFTQQVFPLFNVRFISVSDCYDSDDHKGDTGGMEVTFKYLVNEYYSRDLSVKTKTSKYMKMRKGEYINGVYCYGYKRGEHGEMVVDEATADNVRLIFTLSSEGNSTSDIVKELFTRNILTPSQYKAQQGKKYNVSQCKYWDKSQILRMLHDEQYIGTFVMCKQTVQDVGSTRMRNRDESEWIKIPNHHQAIVSHELFDKVQSVRRTCKFNGRKTHTYPLRTKVVCGCCNHAMQRLPQKEITFACQYTRHDEKEPCYNLRVSEKELHKVLFDIISKQAEIILNINDITELDNLQLKTEQTVELEKQIENCRKEKQHLYEQLLTRKIILDEYQMLKENCDADMRDYELQYDRSCRELEQTKNDNQTREKFIQIAKDVKKENTLTQALADMLIDKVLVYPDKRIDVIWKIQDFCRDIDMTEMS